MNMNISHTVSCVTALWAANKERLISKEMQGDILSYKLRYHNIWKITTRSNTLNINTS